MDGGLSLFCFLSVNGLIAKSVCFLSLGGQQGVVPPSRGVHSFEGLRISF